MNIWRRPRGKAQPTNTRATIGPPWGYYRGLGPMGPWAELLYRGHEIFVKISLFWDVGFCIQNCCQTLWEYFPPIPDPTSPISVQNLPDFGERWGDGRKFPIDFSLFFL